MKNIMAYWPIAQAVSGMTERQQTCVREWGLVVTNKEGAAPSAEKLEKVKARCQTVMRPLAVNLLRDIGLTKQPTGDVFGKLLLAYGSVAASVLNKDDELLNLLGLERDAAAFPLETGFVELPDLIDEIDLTGLVDSEVPDSSTYECLCAYARSVAAAHDVSWSSGRLFAVTSTQGDASIAPAGLIDYAGSVIAEEAEFHVGMAASYLLRYRTSRQLKIPAWTLVAAGVKQGRIHQLALGTFRVRLSQEISAPFGLPKFDDFRVPAFAEGMMSAAEDLFSRDRAAAPWEKSYLAQVQVATTALIDEMLECARVLTRLEFYQSPEPRKLPVAKKMASLISEAEGHRNAVNDFLRSRLDPVAEPDVAVAAEQSLNYLARECEAGRRIADVQDSYSNKANGGYCPQYETKTEDHIGQLGPLRIFILLELARKGVPPIEAAVFDAADAEDALRKWEGELDELATPTPIQRSTLEKMVRLDISVLEAQSVNGKLSVPLMGN